MKCSIVLPYYKNRQPLMYTLQGLSEQTYNKDDYEVIVVDDGNSDQGLGDDIAKAVQAGELNCQVRCFSYKQNQGSGYARNFGLAQACGEVVVFLDSDQIVAPDFVAQHLAFFDQVPDDVELMQVGLRAEISQVPDDWTTLDEFVTYKDPRLAVFERFGENMQSLLGGWHLCFSHNISVRRRVLEQHGGFDEVIFKGWGLEDSEFAYRLQKSGLKIGYNPNILAYHIAHDVSWNSETGYEAWNKNLIAFCDKHPDHPVLMQAIFRDFFDVNVRQQRIEQGDKRPWLSSYQRFEYAVRAQAQSDNISPQIYLKDYTLAQLKEYLEQNPTEHCALMIKRQAIDVMSFVQYHPSAQNVLLMTY